MPQFLLDPAVALALAAVVGLCIGSFLNVVIHRLPRMLERGWQEQCAELRGETPTAVFRDLSDTAAFLRAVGAL